MPSVVGPGLGGVNGPGGHPQQMPHPMMMHDRDMGPPMMHPHMNNPQGMPPNSQHHMIPQMGPGPSPHPPHMHPQPMPMHRMSHFIGQPELRIYEMNKRLQQRSDDTDSFWWDSFASDFFEDDATLTIIAFLEDGPKRYTIGRILIPRYFRSIFESGVGELWFNMRITREAPHPPLVTLDSDCCQIMNMHRPPGLSVIVDGRFTLDFVMEDFRIRSWTFNIRSFREMIARPLLSYQDPNALEHLSKNITRCGIPFNTMNFLRMSVILEPMQELMSRQKAYSLSPRDCLKTTLFQKWQRMMAPQGQPPVKQGNMTPNNTAPETKPSNKRRKRKGSSANSDSSSTGGRATKRKQSPGPLPIPNVAQPGEVMIVGEPTLMGGDFGDEDERRITRLENTQFDPNQCGGGPNLPLSQSNMPHPHMMPPMSMPHSSSGIPPHIAQQQQMIRASMAGPNNNGPPFNPNHGPPPGMTPQQQKLFMQHHQQMMHAQENRPPIMHSMQNNRPMMHGPPLSGVDNQQPIMHPGFANSPQMLGVPLQNNNNPQQANTPSSLNQQHFSGPNTPSSGHHNTFAPPHISQPGQGPDSFQPPRSSSANEMMKRNESNNNSPAISAGNMLMNCGSGHRSNNNTPPPHSNPVVGGGPPFLSNNPPGPGMISSSPLVNSGGSRSIPSSPGMQNIPHLTSQQNSNPHSVPPRNASRGDEE